MSILEQPDAVPSRVVAILQTLLSCTGARESRERLEGLMSPPSLRGGATAGPPRMLQTVIRECVGLGLVERIEAGQEVLYHVPQTVQTALGSRSPDPTRVRALLLQQVLAQGGPPPAPGEAPAGYPAICALLAWFLAQNPTTLDGTQQGLERALDQAGAPNRFLMTNDTRFWTLRYWGAYLGIAWALETDSQSTRILPDPTSLIVDLLPQLFPEGTGVALPILEVSERLADCCPLFPGGAWHAYVKPYLTPLPSTRMAPAVETAWLRLQDRGVIRLEARADAPGYECPDLPQRRVTHASRLKAGKQKGRG